MTGLILAGTAEARALTHQAEVAGFQFIASLAGATERPHNLGGALRVGGFGGADGLRQFLRDHSVRWLIDATHPFAAQMSANAAAATRAERVPLLQVIRPPWPVGECWEVVPDLAAAAKAVVPGARAFLATGRGSLRFFADRRDVFFVVRVIDENPSRFPLAKGHFLASRPPFSVEEEVATLSDHRIDTLVVRNSGGTGGTEKLRAAETLGLPDSNGRTACSGGGRAGHHSRRGNWVVEPNIGRIIETPNCVAEGAAWLARKEPRFAQALELTGPLPLRRRSDGFPGAPRRYCESTDLGRCCGWHLEPDAGGRRVFARRGHAVVRRRSSGLRAITPKNSLRPGVGRQRYRVARAARSAE